MKTTFSVLFLAALLPSCAIAAGTVLPPAAELLYASVGEKLLGYSIDPDTASLTYLSETDAPANVQFAVKNNAGTVLYVVSSNAGNGTLGAKGDTHVLNSYRIDSTSGKLTQFGDVIALPERPINLGLDHQNRFAAVAYNQSATLSVHPIKDDGSVSPAVAQNQVPEAGIFTHQVTFTPGDHTILAMARGNDAVGNVPDQPGSINTFSIDGHGIITKLRTSSIDPGVGPRHLAYHPNQPWAYVAMERGSKLYMYPLEATGELAARPSFRKETLQDTYM
jgi:6-phosphogluconolactonase